MPQLEWDEQDFLQCLAVLPEVEEYEVSHGYTVSKGGLTLLLTVWQLESAIQLSLLREDTEEAVTEFALLVRDRVRYRNDKRGEYLEFLDCLFVPSRFYLRDYGEAFGDQQRQTGMVMRLSVHPQIKFTFQPLY